MLYLDCYSDVKQRKLNYPAKHRYGWNFKANRNLFHVFLLILLAGHVATNPGPCSSFTQSGLKIIYLNARQSSKKRSTFLRAKVSKVCINLPQNVVKLGFPV